MVKKTKGRHRLDKFYYLAKEQGYRSRAAFKLIQLNRKYDFLSSARTLLDLCAAPGGWCQVAVKNMPVGSLILGVDLAPIKPIRGVKTFIGDITTQKCRQQIRKEAAGQLMDVVLHDGAPNVGGAWSSEAYSQSWLVLESLKLATDVLAPRGTFVTKVFRSKDYSALLYALKQLFNKVEATKPVASRNASAEIFVVCQGYKAPAKIDPRLLDAKHLFQDVAEAPKVAGPDALLKAKVKQRRHREGYEEGISSSRKVTAAAAFVCGDSPVEMLGQFTSIALDGGDAEDVTEEAALGDVEAVAEFVRSHPATNPEIRILCSDLLVLGRSEFKQLLKWRLLVKKDLLKNMAAVKAARTAAGEAPAGSESEEEGGRGEEGDEERDPAAAMEDALLSEMSEIKDRLERRQKREKRRRRELKTKSRVRIAQLAQAAGIADEDNGPEGGLFSLSEVRTRKGAGVDGIVDASAPSDDESGEESGEDRRGRSDDEVDSDEERLRYDALMDEYLEESYRSWKVRQRTKDAGGGILKRKRRRLGMDGELEDEEGGDEEEEEVEESEEEEQESEEEGGGLVVSLRERPSGRAVGPAAVADQWFSQDLFDDEDLAEDDESEGEEELPAAKRQQREGPSAAAAVDSDSEEEEKAAANGESNGVHAGGSSSGEEEEGSEDEEEEDGPALKKRQKGSAAATANNYGFGPQDGKVEELHGFEVVPQSDSEGGSDSDGDEYDALDDDAKAEVRALAKKFLRRKSKDDIVEAAYNRYAFHDTALPKWFAEDQYKFMRPAPQITGEEFKAAKEELRAIDARPIKKVAEAQARKRKRLQAKLTQARQKAETVANQEDVPMKAKMREIEKLYAQARNGSKKGGVKKKGGGGRADQYKSKGPPLDARMRKDKRGMDAADRRNKAKGRGGGKGKASRGGKGGGGKGRK